MILQLLSRLFKFKTKIDGQAMHTSGEGSDNAQEAKEVISKPTKIKTMKKAKPNLPASSMLKAPVAAAKVVKKAAKKAAKKKY
jgi:hypothetical protein